MPGRANKVSPEHASVTKHLYRRVSMDVLGIDLAKVSFDATLLLSAGDQHYASFANSAEGFTQLQAWLIAHGVSDLHACMEATTIYWEALATWLHAHSYTVSVVNPARIKGYAQATMQRNKTDKLDSAVIASFCAKHHPTAWEPLSEAHRRLRSLEARISVGSSCGRALASCGSME